ncbi:hypothetical protein [Kitasatospora sp. NPDC058478]|uniref:hypothetical protein n=1 Tax=unclassified Kitasatospora TaxID=2633591 RepID=UPI003659A6ED
MFPDPTSTEFNLDQLAAYVAHLLGTDWQHDRHPDLPAVWHADGVLATFEAVPGEVPGDAPFGLDMLLGDVWEEKLFIPASTDDLAAIGAQVVARIREFREKYGS